MRRVVYISIIFILNMGWFASAQPPMEFNYQAVLRNADGSIIENQDVSVTINILKGAADGGQVFTETHNTSTNAYGLVNLKIGSVNSLESIDWGAETYFVAVVVNGTLMGTTQLLSVPYALHAETAETLSGEITETDPVFTESEAANITADDITNLGNLSGTNTGDQDVSNLATQTALADSTAQVRSEIPDVSGFLTDETDPTIPDHVKNITDEDITQWDEAHTWGDHAQGGYAAQDHTHGLATGQEAGFMSVVDKTKLDGLQNADGSETSVIPGEGITVTGSGTQDDPYEIAANATGGNGLMPVLTKNEIIALSPGTGETVFNKTENLLQVYSENNWYAIQAGCWPAPTSAHAGADQYITDESLSTNLSANTPQQHHGEGMWTIVSGDGGVIDDATNPNTLFTGQECTSYVLQWTISNECGENSDNVSITFNNTPTNANAGPDQSYTDATTSVTLAANAPEAGHGTGSWSIISGEGGSFDDNGKPDAVFSGSHCETYVLRWTITTSCGESTDDLNISFNQTPTIANAGPDQSYTDGTTSVTLAANAPEAGHGTGSWSIISGEGGSFDDPGKPDAVFSGSHCETYVLRWTITTSCGESTDDLNISFNQTPTIANAGPDQSYTDGTTSVTLAANAPEAGHGTGSWSIISGEGGSLDDVNNPNAVFTGQVNQRYELQWTIHSSCQMSSDVVRIIFIFNDPVANIAELRQQSVGEVYVITGEVFITYQSNQRNQKAIQDASGAAILIDDDAGIITTEYDLYDGITGLKGTLSSYNNLLQFVPTEDPGVPSSTGNTVEPTVVTLSEITPDHQSLLIRVNDLEITEDDDIFESSMSYDITDPSGSSTLRTPNGSADLDYFNTVIPSGANDMVAIVSQFNESMQIFPRFLEDIYLAGVPTFTVTFSVKDESDTDITDAVITLGETTGAAGDYVFEDVSMGEYSYTVEKDGFITAENILFINGEGDVETVVLQEEGGLIINSFPYEVGLDADVPPADWDSYSLGDAGAWESTTSSVYSGDAAGLHSFTNDGQNADSWLVSPRIAIGETEELLLKFYERNSFMSAYGYSGVKISTSSGNPAQGQFVEVYESSFPLDDYTERVIDLAPYQGEIIYIAFHYQGEFAHQWYIDEINVDFIPEAVQVTDIASLRQQEQDTLVYELTSEAIITHMHGQRNQKYIQDSSGAAVVIDDPDGIITTNYNLYDGITGLKGILSSFNNLIHFTPVEDPGAPSSTGNQIHPQVVTLNDLTPNHQALLIYVEGVSFTGGSTTFESSTSYVISDVTGSSIFRTPSSSAALDYFDLAIPTEPTNMVAVVSQFGDDMQIFARSSSDFLTSMHTKITRSFEDQTQSEKKRFMQRPVYGRR